MLETELNHIEEEVRPRKMHFDWVFPLFVRPGRTIKTIVTQENGVWFTSLLILSLLAILLVVIGGPARVQAAQVGGELPQDFQYWSPDQQEQYFAGQANRSSPLFIYVFPILGVLAGVWFTWFLLGSILHLSLTLSGSRGTNTAALNLVGWAMLPLALRYIVQGISLLATHQVIQAPGLSGFIAAESGGFMIFLRSVLAHFDIYFLWMVALIMAGVLPLTGLSRGKAWVAVLAAVLIVLALQALPAYLGAALGGLSGSQPFYFF
jgi:hypothetical protein